MAAFTCGTNKLTKTGVFNAYSFHFSHAQESNFEISWIQQDPEASLQTFCLIIAPIKGSIDTNNVLKIYSKRIMQIGVSKESKFHPLIG